MYTKGEYKMFQPKEIRHQMLLHVTDNIILTKKEKEILEWLSTNDTETVNAILSIINKIKKEGK